MCSGLDLLVSALAVWRLAVLLVYEKGPGRVFLKMREAVGVGHDAAGDIAYWNDGFLASVFSCVWCASMWLTPVALVGLHYAPVVVWLLAVAGGAALLDMVRTKNG